MKVWIVQDVNYDVTTIKGAFSTLEKAQAYRDFHLAASVGVSWDIEEVLLDDGEAPPIDWPKEMKV